jgi:hypothetical protein
MRKFCFVGEKPSKTALERGWTWRHGRLAAKQLFDALKTACIVPEDQLYLNLFQSRRDGSFRLNPRILERLRKVSGWCTVVAMGKLVSDRLAAASIRHVAIVHPAARGRIRAKDRYATHVRERLVEKRISY